MLEGGGFITTSSLVVTVCLGLLLLTLPRRYALFPMFIGCCYLTLGQSLVIGGAHFHLIRILIAFGLARLLVKREIFNVTFNAIDKVFIAWVLIRTFAYVLGSGETETFLERLGALYNAVGVYFLIRAVVRSFDDIIFNVKMLGITIIPLAVPFLIEYITGKNLFSVLGGVPEFTQIREGRYRCQGAFAHPILAGTFGATLVPIFVGLWGYSPRDRFLAFCALLVATLIVIVSSSSGPLLAYLVTLVGLTCWMFKARIRTIRWGIAILFLGLSVVMKAPVWFVISRIAELTGGSGWYRSALIDAFVSRFDEWWLIGTTHTVHWMPTGLSVNQDMTDIVNHFIAQGVSGGLLCLILFIWLIVMCFKVTGKAIRDETRFSSAERFMIWALGCTILGHVVSFFSVSYFDQLNVFWYLIVGMIAALVPDGRKRRALRHRDTSKKAVLDSNWARFMAGGRPSKASWGRASF